MTVGEYLNSLISVTDVVYVLIAMTVGEYLNSLISVTDVLYFRMRDDDIRCVFNTDRQTLHLVLGAYSK